MKKSATLFLAVVLSTLSMGCVISGTPAEDPLFVSPGATKTFGAIALGNLDNLLWTVDDVEVQSGGDAYAYTAPHREGTDHLIAVELPGALGNDRYQWNVNTDADVAPSSPNNHAHHDSRGSRFDHSDGKQTARG